MMTVRGGGSGVIEAYMGQPPPWDHNNRSLERGWRISRESKFVVSPSLGQHIGMDQACTWLHTHQTTSAGECRATTPNPRHNHRDYVVYERRETASIQLLVQNDTSYFFTYYGKKSA
jgi:hypothetical protein